MTWCKTTSGETLYSLIFRGSCPAGQVEVPASDVPDAVFAALGLQRPGPGPGTGSVGTINVPATETSGPSVVSQYGSALSSAPGNLSKALGLNLDSLKALGLIGLAVLVGLVGVMFIIAGGGKQTIVMEAKKR